MGLLARSAAAPYFQRAMSDDAFDPRERAAQKQASRAQDEAALASGEKSPEDLRRENAAFGGRRVRPNLAAAHTRR